MDWMTEVREYQRKRYQKAIDRARFGLEKIAEGWRFEEGSDRGMVDVTDARKAELLARIGSYTKLLDGLRPTAH